MPKFGTKGDSNVVYKCTVRLLEDVEILECEFKAHHKGKYLFDHVCKQLNLIEQDYLGLRFVDSTNQRHWLDLAKNILKQVKDTDRLLFCFRVKFYPPDPFRLKEEITRYQIFLQLKRDLLHGRLYCTANEAAMLAALIIQGDLGDYDPEIHLDNYISDCKLLLKQTEAIEEKVMEIHKTQLKGQSPSQAENNFLKIACQLDTYGVDPHPVKDHRGVQLYLGINFSGILTFQGNRKTHHFRWPDIHKINFEGKMFIIHLNYNEKKHTVGFKCPSGAACKYVWRCAYEQMLFFTLPSSSDAPLVVTGGGFFSWGTKFKYTGRTEREVLEDYSAPTREEPSIQRTSSMRRKASSVPATPSTPLNLHSTLPRSSQSDAGGTRMENSNSAGLICGLDSAGGGPFLAESQLETVREDQETHTSKLRSQGLKDDGGSDRLNDYYYFRDSFEHSSSESQLVDSTLRSHEAVPLRTSRCSTPLPGELKSNAVAARAAAAAAPPGVAAASSAAAAGKNQQLQHQHSQQQQQQQQQQQKVRRFKLVRVFVPSVLVTALLMFLLLVVLLEFDGEMLRGVRDLPEMVSLRYHYYEPLKQYFRSKISGII